MNTPTWYSQLVKPSWAPPSWVFGPVWSVLYMIIAVSYGTIFYKAYTKQIPWMVALPFILNLVFNFLFSPIQFGLKINILASVDILLVLGTMVWAGFAIWNSFPDLRWVVYANIPYFLWVAFATSVQLAITYLNW